MADGVRRIAGTTWGLAVTGIAGPGGGTPDKPVGTVCIAVAGEHAAQACRYRFSGTREQITLMSCHMALAALRRAVLGLAPPGPPGGV
jgi:nicotinamide-nucleotide amidase